MSKNVIQTINNFDFSKITLSQPYSIQGGSYFTKLLYNTQQLYIQGPKCFTKQGIINSNQKIYTDLLLSQCDNNFIEWFENLETKLQNLIYDKRNLWFHNELEITDIETAFTSPVKLYKSGKKYLIRCNLGRIQGLNFESPIRIFNENEIDIKLKDITNETPIICILEISGIRFSSRSFNIDINIKQIMAIQSESTFDKCLINLNPESEENLEMLDDNEDQDEDQVSVEDQVAVEDQVVVEDNIEDEEEIDNKVEDHDEEQVGEEIEHKNTDQDVNTDANADINKHENANKVANDNDNNSYSKNINIINEKNEDIENKTYNETASKTLGNIQDSKLINENLEEISEASINLDNLSDKIELKSPDVVYLEIYLQAREKAKLAKKKAIQAYLEAKNIKNTYLLEKNIDSEEESDDEFINFSDS